MAAISAIVALGTLAFTGHLPIPGMDGHVKNVKTQLEVESNKLKQFGRDLDANR